ncbi:MAG TPA: cupin domain-containing protein [Pseudonocardiaceae bacterium]|jgi:mannose-6-phosphate isomerase-like protein (cupin superfamily)|nr:cupin domain-containing protein [Pseudonocardiaceae bacterium]
MLMQRLERSECVQECGILCQPLTLTAPSIKAPFKSMWCVLEPGSSSDPDQHEQAEMVVVVAGEAVLTTDDGAVLHAVPGTVVHLPPQARHTVHNPCPDRPLVLLSVYWFIDPRSNATTGSE